MKNKKYYNFFWINLNLSKNELKYYISLLQKKFRKEENKFLAEGKKIIDEAIKSKFFPELVICTANFLESEVEFINVISQMEIEIKIISEKDFFRISDTESPQGIVAIFDSFEFTLNDLNSDVIVALENISDPGNMGTIIRSSDWFGYNDILISQESAEIFNPKVIRSSMGSIFHTKFVKSNDFLEDLLELKQSGYNIIIADLDGENLYETKMQQKTVLVFCNEAKGPSFELKKIQDGKITIPKYGKAESLNVANASAVILSHLAKNLQKS